LASFCTTFFLACLKLLAVRVGTSFTLFGIIAHQNRHFNLKLCTIISSGNRDGSQTQSHGTCILT
jgi:hypothetical protein